MDVQTFQRLGLDRSLWDLEPGLIVNDRSNMDIMAALDTEKDREYQPCAEAGEALETPRGHVVHFDDWESSTAYPGTTRDIWLYSPARGIGESEPSLVVFQDGGMYLDSKGPIRATAVFETLVNSGELPPLVAIFISSGRKTGISAAEAATDPNTGRQRSVEYDSCDDTYLRFLRNEVLPFAERELSLQFTPDPSRRLIGGISSGAICAFNAAWHSPETFGLVLSHCGSYTNIRGGHNYPYLIRTTPRKAIRVFLQSGVDDANILYGNWPLANKDMAAALEFAGYQFKFEFGRGGHSPRHGGSLFAESLRWLFSG